jgi:uncharacterized membrane protein YvlD (DUF360 family)
MVDYLTSDFCGDLSGTRDSLHLTGWQLGVIAAIFSVVNLLLRPILTLITCPMIILTLGLFSVAINALLLMFTANVAIYLGIEYSIDSFTAAFIGALVISFTSLISYLLPVRQMYGSKCIGIKVVACRVS